MPANRRIVAAAALALLPLAQALAARAAAQTSEAPAEVETAPLAAELREARTVVLLDTTMDFALSTRFQTALEEWGRFEIVFTPDEADVCMALSTRADYTKEEIDAGGEVDGDPESDDPLQGRASGTMRVLDKLYFRIFVPGSTDDLWRDEADVGDDEVAAAALVERLRRRLEADAAAPPDAPEGAAARP
jgi:hypothetical protein